MEEIVIGHYQVLKKFHEFLFKKIWIFSFLFSYLIFMHFPPATSDGWLQRVRDALECRRPTRGTPPIGTSGNWTLWSSPCPPRTASWRWSWAWRKRKKIKFFTNKEWEWLIFIEKWIKYIRNWKQNCKKFSKYKGSTEIPSMIGGNFDRKCKNKNKCLALIKSVHNPDFSLAASASNKLIVIC